MVAHRAFSTVFSTGPPNFGTDARKLTSYCRARDARFLSPPFLGEGTLLGKIFTLDAVIAGLSYDTSEIIGSVTYTQGHYSRVPMTL